jgi:hypothetical protein
MQCGAAFAFPLGEVGALILWDVEALGPQEQTGLLAWIDAHPRTTIVSTTAHLLFACVARELFDAELYYRLNVLLLSADMETSAHGTARDGAHAATILTVCSGVDSHPRRRTRTTGTNRDALEQPTAAQPGERRYRFETISGHRGTAV